MNAVTIRSVMAGFIFILIITTAHAQTFLFQSIPEDNPEYSLTFSRPKLSDGADISTFSGIYDFAVTVPVSSHMNIVGSLPLTTVAYDDESESGIGNIFIGLQNRQLRSTGRISNQTFGVFLPTASENKLEVYSLGLLTNFQDVHMYMPNTLTLLGSYSYRSTETEHTLFGTEIGSVVWIPTDDKSRRDTELLMRYGLAGGLKTDKLAVFAELVGLVIITEDVDNFRDRFEHAFAFGAQWLGSIVRPGIFYQLYIEDDFSNVVDGVLGIKIAYGPQ